MWWRKGKIPDAELRRMLLSGDPTQVNAAFDNLIEYEGPDIKRMLGNLSADEMDMNDFLLEAIGLLHAQLEADLKKSREESPDLRLQIGNFGGWLAGTAKNKWLNELDRRKHLKKIAEELAKNPPPTSHFNAEAAMAFIEKVLERIGECKQLLIWRFLDGFGLTEVADRLHLVSPDAVSKRIQHCLRRAGLMSQDLDLDIS